MHVTVGGVTYGPADLIPADVAAGISNPAVWGQVEQAQDAAGPPPGASRAPRGGGRRLAGHVTIAGVTYGPDDEVPEQVALLVTNPGAWADGGEDPAAPKPDPELESDPGSDPGSGLDELDEVVVNLPVDDVVAHPDAEDGPQSRSEAPPRRGARRH